ncbi:MAG: pantoate--beta-alanine ligase [Planctomycetota bacterium]
MQVAATIDELRAMRHRLGEEVPLALVPTMGALHDGHLSLVELARKHVGPRGHVAASVFVNPTQFNDPADLAAYPKPLENDLEQLRAAGVDLAFTPSPDEMYPADALDVAVDVPALARVLEGEHRPGHFAGVCRVVLKLFHLFEPDAAVFGSKDFQQLRIIEAMTTGLNLPMRILRAPTQRDADGLAMSSRNARLSPEARKQALAIPQALDAAAAADDPERAMRQVLDAADLELDYAAVVDPVTLQPTNSRPRLLAIAATVGGVRLIDNRLLD